MKAATDTIVAVGTPAGRGALGVLRMSGPQALAIAEVLAGPLPPARQAALRNFRDAAGEALDRGLLLCFSGPHSYTGEDLAELQAHGSPVLLHCLAEAARSLGARFARPGEFTERAFLNGRLDLAQAEAVADLIDASHRGAVRAAHRSLEGEFSRRVQQLVEALIQLRVYVEAALDFSDEDIDWLADVGLRDRLARLHNELRDLLANARQGRRLSAGMRVALAGRPNAGKSTLLNRLAGAEAAIVSAIPGTTRDLLREQILVEDLPLTLIDTAGLRATDDPVELEGIRRARGAIADAELLLYLVDDRDGLGSADLAELARLPADAPLLLLWTKCDLSARAPELWTDSQGRRNLRLSAQSGAGCALLNQELRRAAGLGDTSENLFSARARHLEALESAGQHLDLAQSRLHGQHFSELAAEELRLAQEALASITGAFTADDLLGRIFGSFCIGK